MSFVIHNFEQLSRSSGKPQPKWKAHLMGHLMHILREAVHVSWSEIFKAMLSVVETDCGSSVATLQTFIVIPLWGRLYENGEAAQVPGLKFVHVNSQSNTAAHLMVELQQVPGLQFVHVNYCIGQTRQLIWLSIPLDVIWVCNCSSTLRLLAFYQKL